MTSKRLILQAEIDALRQAEADSSPGPWRDVSKGGTFGQFYFSFHGGKRQVGSSGDLRGVDARFIVLAKELVPSLLAEVERLKAELAKAKAAVRSGGS